MIIQILLVTVRYLTPPTQSCLIGGLLESVIPYELQCSYRSQSKSSSMQVNTYDGVVSVSLSLNVSLSVQGTSEILREYMVKMAIRPGAVLLALL